MQRVPPRRVGNAGIQRTNAPRPAIPVRPVANPQNIKNMYK